MRGSSALFYKRLLSFNASRLSVVAVVALGLGLSACGKSVGAKPKPIRKFPVAEDPIPQENNENGARPNGDDTPQNIVRQDWFNLDPELDGIEGLGANRIYNEILVNGREKDLAPIIVAVIDSGVDINHEDLKNKIWTNPGETGLDAAGKDKASNGIDDDNNGYVDDIHGWNYIGGYDAEGKPVSIGPETLEKTRIYKKLQDKLDSGLALTEEEQALYDKTKKEVTEEKAAAVEELAVLNPALAEIEEAYPAVAALLGDKPVEALTRDEVAALESNDSTVNAAKDKIVAALDRTGFTSVARLMRFIELDNESVEYYYNPDFNPRAQIVGDNPDDFSDVGYGNNDVMGVDADHGTHVSGMIAAERGNGIGIDGVANSALIMSLRAVPNGDERDKDVALAIRYAADNGAQVINMSFGKQYSPNRAEVQEAIEYAEAKGLLLVHAAGNDGKNTTEILNDNFPTPNKIGDEGRVNSWVEVGAASSKKDANLPAVFSNFGNESVDIFAQGVRVESTIPGNQYAIFSGTSMASPAFAGAAALIWSMKPDLTAAEVKELLLENGRTYDGLMVNIPSETGPIGQTLFANLSITGKVANALSTMLALLEM
ncbi:MAG: S8 family serine peptidase [Bdellovibrionota bacterium]